MPEESDDLAEIAASGAIAPIGQRAAMRLQAHAGHYHVAPSPPGLVVLRRRATPDAPARTCLLSGVIPSAGALCDVLGFVAHAGWRGELVVREDTSSRSIFFDQGSIVSAQSDVVRERLGEVLYRHGLLTREQVKAAGDALADGTMRFGEAAVKLGYLSREKLFELMARQTEEIFYGMLLVTGGMFYFLDTFEDADLSMRHRLLPSELVRDGIRRMHEMKYFRARIPSEAHVPMRVANRPMPEDAGPVYDAIDGARNVAEICRMVGEGEVHVTRSLFQLIQAGDIVVKPPAIDMKAAVEVMNRAVALILRELDALDQGDSVRDQLAKFVRTKPAILRAFHAAGPADDGRFDPDVVARNMAKSDGKVLAASLFEYASYAVFLARPHLRRQQKDASDQPRLSMRVSAMLEPIAPESTRKA